jgi:alpha-tubulin suppressor-like RCC1 family protein
VYFPEEKILNRKFEIHVTHAQRVLIKAIASGSSHCLALTTNGNVFSWGNGQGGRLGHGNTIGKDTPIQIMALAHKTIE